jgi:uncharacterized protein (DUF58 family)
MEHRKQSSLSRILDHAVDAVRLVGSGAIDAARSDGGRAVSRSHLRRRANRSVGDNKKREASLAFVFDFGGGPWTGRPQGTKVNQTQPLPETIEQLFRKRGHVLVTGFELSTRFPFGFFRHRRRLRSREVDIVVYPKPQRVADELHLLPLFTGQSASFRRGFGHDLLMLRDYQQRDDLRHIDWKATARARRLTVREFTAEDERRMTILLDTRLTEDIDPENFRIRFEHGVIQAASLVKHFIDERAEVSVVLGNESTTFGQGLEHLYVCLRKLALVQPDRQTSGDRELERMVDTATARDGRGSDTNYLIILTASERGSIPPNVWRRAYVIFL